MKLFIPLADGFEEIEAMSTVSVLRGNGIKVDIVGITGSTVTSDSGTKVLADKRMLDVDKGSYDGIVIPGGKGCSSLEKSKFVMDAIRDYESKGKLVAAICIAPSLLAKAGILEKRKATVYPGMEKDIPYPRDEKVVVDRNVITSQGPATSLQFALAIVEHLLGKAKAEKSRKYLLV